MNLLEKKIKTMISPNFLNLVLNQPLLFPKFRKGLVLGLQGVNPIKRSVECAFSITSYTFTLSFKAMDLSSSLEIASDSP